MTLAQLEAGRRSVETNGGTISYIDLGSGSPALFVHGVGTNAHLWRNVIASLHGERRCIAPDLPLHGRSPGGPGQEFGLAAFARLLEAFCAELGLSSVDLVANDTGGAIARSSPPPSPLGCGRSR